MILHKTFFNKMSMNLHNKSLLLHLHGRPIHDWMDISVISIPLDHIYHLSVGGQEPQTVGKWHERVVLPEVLSMLESFCVKWGIGAFGAFSDACNAMPDPLLVMAFMPIDDS